MGLGFNRDKFNRNLGKAGEFFAKPQPTPQLRATAVAPPPPPVGNFLDRQFGTRLTYKPAPLPVGESVHGNWYGSVSGVGSTVSVTDSQVAVSPVDTDNARKLFLTGARVFGVHGAGVANAALDRSGVLKPRTVPVSSITSVQPVGRRGVQLNLADGERVSFGVNRTPFTPNMSRKNVQSRDELAAQLEAAIAAYRNNPSS